ncbi:MAG: hypothetical protein WCI02_17960 [Planctomycetota bacterium]|jgi:enediyne biosynthesis thioesterase
MITRSQIQTIHPRVTFQDTNIVGNVYYLNFFRWQLECRDEWLRLHRPEVWSAVQAGRSILRIVHWSNRFEDPFGATIGDSLSVAFNVTAEEDHSESARVEVFRHFEETVSRLAAGVMSFEFLEHESSVPIAHPDEDEDGSCYTMHVTSPIERDLSAMDLIAWQGKCREMFLEDQASEILHQVISRQLVLQTTTASLDWTGECPSRGQRIRVEMRLQSLKCGQMGVRFHYFEDSDAKSKRAFAVGEQSMSSKHSLGDSIAPCPLPKELVLALKAYTDSPRLKAKIDDILAFAAAAPEPISHLSR